MRWIGALAALAVMAAGTLRAEPAPSAQGEAGATDFAAGIDAYVADVEAGKQPLPVEFQLPATAPALWTAADVVRIRSHGLTRNLASEVARAMVTCKAGLGADQLRRKLEPAWTTKVPPGLDPCDVTADVLKDYALGTAEVSFAPA